MTLAPPVAPADALAPLQLPADPRLTPEQFAVVCQANPNAALERFAGPVFPGLRMDLHESWTD